MYSNMYSSMHSQLRLLAALCLMFLVMSQSSPCQTPNADAAPLATTNVTVTVDVLSNRHTISPYVYGGAYPQDAPTITDSGLTVVRWGGDSTSRYNWKLQTNNAGNDWYFEDFAYSEIGDSDSVKYLQDVVAAGSHPIMTMPMLSWVAKAAENSSNKNWSFSVAKYGAQCATDPYNSDAGDGLKPDCSTILTASSKRRERAVARPARDRRPRGQRLSQPVDGGAGPRVRRRSAFLQHG